MFLKVSGTLALDTTVRRCRRMPGRCRHHFALWNSPPGLPTLTDTATGHAHYSHCQRSRSQATVATFKFEICVWRWIRAPVESRCMAWLVDPLPVETITTAYHHSPNGTHRSPAAASTERCPMRTAWALLKDPRGDTGKLQGGSVVSATL